MHKKLLVACMLAAVSHSALAENEKAVNTQTPADIKQLKNTAKQAKRNGENKHEKLAAKANKKLQQKEKDINESKNSRQLDAKKPKDKLTGLEKQQAKKAEQLQNEATKGSQQGKAAREENSKKWWKFWGE